MRIINCKNIVCLLLAFFSSLSVFFKKPVSKEKPNFVIILIDDLGEKDVGAYGNIFIDTPNIDRLAAEGMTWTNAYSSAPICSPSRVAILTGKNPARVGFTGHITSVRRHRHPKHSRIIPPRDLMHIPKREVILPEAIKPAGYRTISIGKWHIGEKGYWPTDMGFDENIAGYTQGSPPSYWFPYKNPDKPWNSSIPTLKGGKKGEYLTDRLTTEAIKFIKANKNRPFLVYLSQYAVHTPLQAPKKLVEKYKKKRSNDGNKEINPIYAAMVENVDQNVGRLLHTLNKLGLQNNTVVIFASDNGARQDITDNSPYRSGKGHLYEGGLRVPFLMRWPGHIPSGSICDQRTVGEDIYPTIVDIAGKEAKPGKNLDGKSLVEYFSGNKKVTGKRDSHWFYPEYSGRGNHPGAAIISGDYKLFEFYDPHKIKLYNLSKDIGETNDLSDKDLDKMQELRSKLRMWLHDMNPIMPTPNPNYMPKKGGYTE